MRRATLIAAAAALVGSVLAVSVEPARADPAGPLSAAGSVNLADLPAVTGVDGIASPERRTRRSAEGEEGSGHDGAGPRVRGSRVRDAGNEVKVTFAGLNHRNSRLTDGGNQFSTEPPDQGLCVGGDHVVEMVNTVVQVYTKAGAPLLGANGVSLNRFFGFPSAFDRTNVVFGPSVFDPACHYDADTGRYVLIADVLGQDPATGDLDGTNLLAIAVSKTSDPTGEWFLYRLNQANDGTGGTPNHGCDGGPCFGDYPHIGADKHGIYLSTNEYSLFGEGYTGAQIYAISKRQLAAGAPSPALVHFESPKLGPFRSFTVWPAISPAGKESRANNGTEFLLSSTLGDGSETGNTAPSENRIGAWAITNTASLDSAQPRLRLTSRLIEADTYALPPQATQKYGPTPLRDCLNDRTDRFGPGLGCWALLLPEVPPTLEEFGGLDSLDTRMQQVVYADGMAWGAMGTAVGVKGRRDGRGGEARVAEGDGTDSARGGWDDRTSTRAGVLWVGVRIGFDDRRFTAETKRSGYVAVDDNDVTMPAIAVSRSGRVVMAATVSGDDHYPSAAYAVLDDQRPTVRIISAGKGPQDGFSEYDVFNGGAARPRWGDYGAAAMDGDTLWFASESIEQQCTLDEWLTGAIGSCGGTRTALANWATRITAIRI